MVILELAPGHDTDALAHSGEAADVGIADLPCRRLLGAAWPNLLVVVDRQTIVTGEESLLRALGRQGDAKLESGPLGAALRRQSRRRRHVAGRSGRGQGGPLETAHRPVGRVAGAETAFARLCDSSVGLGCTLYWSQPVRSELALVCESETAAEKVRLDAEELLRTAKRVLPKRAESLSDAVVAGKVPPAATETYLIVLEDGEAALDAPNCRSPTASSGCV